MSSNTGNDFVLPEASGLSKSTVSRYAEQLANALGYQPGADLAPVVARLEGEIEYNSFYDSTSAGSLEVFPHSSPLFRIRLSAFAGDLRNRFTIAHELGHYFLHSDGGVKRIRAYRAGSGRVEWEANWFAGGFLLPETQFKNDWEHLNHNVPLLAQRYQVSEAVVEIRRENLGLAL